jgi:hypothetical protein
MSISSKGHRRSGLESQRPATSDTTTTDHDESEKSKIVGPAVHDFSTLLEDTFKNRFA